MLPALEERRDANPWRKLREISPERKILSFELLPNRITSNSACFSIYRAKVPGGWLVAMRPSDSMTFLPDPLHEWDGGSLA